MTALPTYSSLFSTLYDEQNPVGNLGRGTHYSVLRSVEWLDVTRRPLEKPQIHDFAVIWDEDHDIRVIEAAEALYMNGLLSPVQFIGERKGTLTVLVASRFWFDAGIIENLQEYIEQVEAIVSKLPNGDYWPTEVGMFDRSPVQGHQFEPKWIIDDDAHRVEIYLKNVDSLWKLGTKNWKPTTAAEDGIRTPVVPLPAQAGPWALSGRGLD